MSDIFFHCSECDGPLVVDEAGRATQIRCPHCGRTTTIPDPPALNELLAQLKLSIQEAPMRNRVPLSPYSRETRVSFPEGYFEKVGARKKAIESLIGWQDPRVLGALREVCENDPSADVRQTAVRVLGDFADTSAVDPLLAVLDRDRNARVRAAAAEALGKLGDKRAIEPLMLFALMRYNHLDLEVSEGGRFLEGITTEEDFRNVRDIMCHAAAKALVQMRDDNIVTQLIAEVENLHLNHAAEILGEIGDVRAVEPLIKLLLLPLDHEEGHWIKIRELAAKALSKIGDFRAVEPLIRILSDKTSLRNLRLHAAHALAVLHKKDANRVPVDSIIGILDDPAPAVREQVARLLGESGDRRAVTPLIRNLGAVDALFDQSASLAVATALEQLGEPKWRQAVRGEIKDLSDFRRLAALNDPRAVDPMMRLLLEALFNTPSWSQYVVCLAELLGDQRDTRAIEPLLACLGDHHEAIRIVAAKALEKLGEPRWATVVQGNDGDLRRLADLGDPRVGIVLLTAWKLPARGSWQYNAENLWRGVDWKEALEPLERFGEALARGHPIDSRHRDKVLERIDHLRWYTQYLK